MPHENDFLYQLAKHFFIKGDSLEYIATITSQSLETIQLWKAEGNWSEEKEHLDKVPVLRDMSPPKDLMETRLILTELALEALYDDYEFGCKLYTSVMKYLQKLEAGELKQKPPTNPEFLN